MIHQQPLTPKSPKISISKLKTYETHRNQQTSKFTVKNNKRRSTHNQKNIFKLTNSTKTLPASHGAQQFERILKQKRNYQQMIKTELKRLEEFESVDNQQFQFQEFHAKYSIVNSEFDAQEYHPLNESISPKPTIQAKHHGNWDWQQDLGINNSKSQALQQLIFSMKKQSFYDKFSDNLQANTKMRASTYLCNKNLISTYFYQWKQITKENNIDNLNSHTHEKSQQLHRIFLIKCLNEFQKLSIDKRTINRGTILQRMITYRRQKTTLMNFNQIHKSIKGIKVKKNQIFSHLKASNLKSLFSRHQNKRNIQTKTILLLNIRLHQRFIDLCQEITTRKQMRHLRHSIQNSNDSENQIGLFEPKQLTQARSLLLADKSVKQLLKARRSRETFKLLGFQYKLCKFINSDLRPKPAISMMHLLINNLKTNQRTNKKQKSVNKLFASKYLNLFFMNLKSDTTIKKSIQKCKDKNHETNNSLFNTNGPTMQAKSRFRKTKRKYLLKLFYSRLNEEYQMNKKLRLTGQVLSILNSQNLKSKIFNIMKYHQSEEMSSEHENHEQLINDQSNQYQSKQYQKASNERSFDHLEQNKKQVESMAQNQSKDEQNSSEQKCKEVNGYLLQKTCILMLNNLKSINQLNKKSQIARNRYKKFLIIKSITKLKQHTNTQAHIKAQSQKLANYILKKQLAAVCRKLKHNATLQSQKKAILKNMSQQHVESALKNQQLGLQCLKEEMIRNLIIRKRRKELISLLGAHRIINKNSIAITKNYLQNCLNLMTNSARHKQQIRQLLYSKKNEINSYLRKRQISRLIVANPHEESGRTFLIANRQYRRKVKQLREIRCLKLKEMVLANLEINYHKKLNKKMVKLSNTVINLFNRSSCRVFSDFATAYKKQVNQDKDQHIDEFSLTDWQNNVLEPASVLKNSQKSSYQLVNQDYHDKGSTNSIHNCRDLQFKQQNEDLKRQEQSLDILESDDYLSEQCKRTQSNHFIRQRQSEELGKSLSNVNAHLMKNRQGQLQQCNRSVLMIQNRQEQSEQWNSNVSKEGAKITNNYSGTLSCEFEEKVENDGSFIENEQYFSNRYSMSLINKTFNVLKYNLKSHQNMNKNYPFDNSTQDKDNLIRKCWQGLKMFSRQKCLVKKYLQEFDNLETYCYFPRSKEQFKTFKQIQSNAY